MTTARKRALRLDPATLRYVADKLARDARRIRLQAGEPIAETDDTCARVRENIAIWLRFTARIARNDETLSTLKPRGKAVRR